jgi:hypothetical protein
MKKPMKPLAALAAATTLLCLQHAVAGPSDYVFEPKVEYGEREIDLKFGHASNRAPGDDEQAASSLGFGYGATEHWFTEFYVKWKNTDTDGTHYDALEWENKFQLTETGEYPVDVGFITEIEHPQDHGEGWEVKMGPLFQTEFGKLQANANFLFTRNYKSATPNPTQFGYQVQLKYRWRPAFEYGLQGFGDMGDLDHWGDSRQQSQRFGPAIFGRIGVGQHKAVRYNAALLFGTTAGAPKQTFRLQAEYEF